MRPEVRIVDQQQVVNNEVHGSEAEELLRKYGYSSQPTIGTQPAHISDNRSFEEMCKELDDRQSMMRNSPKPITFSGKHWSNTSYASDSEAGISFRVDIVSDMKIPR